MAQIDRTTDLIGNAGFKNPCRVATTAALAQLSGLLTVDGVVLETGDRVLVKDQASGADNGIYVVDTGTWSRSRDCDGSYDLVQGALTFINDGATNGGKFFKMTTADPEIGTSSLVWTVGLFSDLSTATFTQAGAGAVSITAQEKMRQEVSVLDFGAVGDGTTHPLSTVYGTLAAAQAVYSFATALTQEIDYCAAVAAIATGKRVIFNAGYTFLVDGKLVLANAKQEMAIRGVVKLKDATNQPVFEVTANRVKIRFEGGEIDGNKANQTTVTDSLGSGIWIENGVDRCEIWDPYIHDTKRSCIAGYGNNDDCTVIGGELADPGLMGVYPSQASNRPNKRWLMSGIYIHGFAQDGIGTVAIQHGVISGNRIVYDSAGIAISCVALEALCNYTTVHGNTFEGNATTVQYGGTGVQVNDSHNVTVSGNTCKQLSMALNVPHEDANTYSISFIGNTCDDCGYGGYAIGFITAAAAFDLKSSIIGNTVRACPYAGILLHGASHCIVTGNIVDGVNLQNSASKRHIFGIAFSNIAAWNTVTDNMIMEGTGGNLKIGIHAAAWPDGGGGATNTIKDNRILGADYDIICCETSQTQTLFSKVTRTLEATVVAQPITGHWEKGQSFRNEQPSIGNPIEWVCDATGTFGADTGVAAIDAAARVITFANAADVAKFHSGMKIRIAGAGVAGADLDTYISGLDGTSLSGWVKDAASTTVAAAAVSLVPPTFCSLTLS